MNSITKVGAVIAIFAATAAAANDSGNNKRLLRKTRNQNRKNQRLATKKRTNNNNADADITEDVAFWTRSLQSSMVPPPTPPVLRPTPNPTPAPVAGTDVPVTPNPTDATTYTPTEAEDTPAPTPGDAPPATTPVANDDVASLSSGGDFAFIAVLDNDIPAAGESLIVQSIEKQADNGECTISLDLIELTYMPDPSFSGEDTCIYRACDSVPQCDDATVTFTVG